MKTTKLLAVIILTMLFACKKDETIEPQQQNTVVPVVYEKPANGSIFNTSAAFRCLLDSSGNICDTNTSVITDLYPIKFYDDTMFVVMNSTMVGSYSFVTTTGEIVLNPYSTVTQQGWLYTEDARLFYKNTSIPYDDAVVLPASSTDMLYVIQAKNIANVDCASTIYTQWRLKQ